MLAAVLETDRRGGLASSVVATKYAWEDVVRRYYEAAFIARAAEAQVVVWGRLNLALAILGGLSASAGGLAGGIKAGAVGGALLGPILAWSLGVGAVVASATNLTKRIQEHERTKGRFATFSSGFNMLLEDIKAQAGGVQERYVRLRNQCAEASATLPSDPLVTQRFLRRIEKEVEDDFRKRDLIE